MKAVGFWDALPEDVLAPCYTQHGAESHQQTHTLFAPSRVSAGQGSSVLGKGFNSCCIPQGWQQQVQEAAEQGCGWLMGNFGIAGGKGSMAVGTAATGSASTGATFPRDR